MPLSHPLFVPAKGLAPVVRLRIGGSGPGAITGHVALPSAPGDAQDRYVVPRKSIGSHKSWWE